MKRKLCGRSTPCLDLIYVGKSQVKGHFLNLSKQEIRPASLSLQIVKPPHCGF